MSPDEQCCSEFAELLAELPIKLFLRATDVWLEINLMGAALYRVGPVRYCPFCGGTPKVIGAAY